MYINGVQHVPFRGRMIPIHDYESIIWLAAEVSHIEAKERANEEA